METRSTPRRSRRSGAPRAAATPLRNTPRRVITEKRPSIPNAISTAYGAPGRVNLPGRVATRSTANLLNAMRDMVEENEDSNSGSSRIVDEGSENEDEDELEDKEEQKPEIQVSEDEDEVDEISISEEVSDEEPRQAARPRGDLQPTSSPFTAVRDKIRDLWGSSARDFDASFLTEDKIASEARIRRPGEPLTRKLLRLREKVASILKDIVTSPFMKALGIAVAFFVGALILLFSLQAASSAIPEDIEWKSSFSTIKESITSPLYSVIDNLPPISRSRIPNLPEGADSTQYEALKVYIETSLRNMRAEGKQGTKKFESMVNQLAARLNTPVKEEKKINLFAPGAGLSINPYLSSPTRLRDIPQQSMLTRWTRELKNRNLVTRWFSHAIGIPAVEERGPIQAFTEWKGMGDCWCSPDSGGRAQIAMILASPVIPKELVVEHISKDETLRTGSAPRDIELWVQIDNARKRDAVVKAALHYGLHQNIDIQSEGVLQALDETWVKIGIWKYDINLSNNIQSFDVQVPLEDFDAPVTRFAFRTASNWGPSKFVCIYQLRLHGLTAVSEPNDDNGFAY